MVAYWYGTVQHAARGGSMNSMEIHSNVLITTSSGYSTQVLSIRTYVVVVPFVYEVRGERDEYRVT